MTIRIILTVQGSDRPGLTQAMAEAIVAAGGNWLEGHLARLGGQYVGSVLVELDEFGLPILEAEIRKVDATGLRVAIVPAGDAPPTHEKLLGIEVVGQDRPGIIREMATALSQLGVNIEELSSQTEIGPWSGEKLFRAKAKLALPLSANFNHVQKALESISGEIVVDISVIGAD